MAQHRTKMIRKGQLFSGDITTATMVFLLALALSVFIWDSSVEDINNAENLRNMEKVASETVEQLIRTPGVPEDWNYYTVQVVGLSSEDRIIDSSKATEFLELMNSSTTDYDDNKHKLGLGIYDFYVNVTDINGTLVQVNGIDFIAGKEPTNSYTTLSVFRTAVYNDIIIRFNFVIWRGS